MDTTINNNNAESKISTIVAMGFDSSQAQNALNVCNGDIERSVEYLVSGGGGGDGNGGTNNPPAVQAATAVAVPQYSPYSTTNTGGYDSRQQPPPSPPQYQQQVQYITFKHDRRGPCLWILNILWIVIAGWHMFLSWASVGVALCLTCIFIPCGYQILKISFFLLFPFGMKLQYTDDENTIKDDADRCCVQSCNCFLNIIWAITIGWILALQAFVTGLLLCLTIIGIPFGISCFQLSMLCFRPFGLTFTADELEVIAVTTTTTSPTKTNPGGTYYHHDHSTMMTPAIAV